MQNGTLELDNISFVLTKSEDNRDLLAQQFATGKISFGFVNMQHQTPLQLFGAAIDIGPVVMQGEAEVNDLSTTLKTFQDAGIGTGVRISLKPPCSRASVFAFWRDWGLGSKLGSN